MFYLRFHGLPIMTGCFPAFFSCSEEHCLAAFLPAGFAHWRAMPPWKLKGARGGMQFRVALYVCMLELCSMLSCLECIFNASRKLHGDQEYPNTGCADIPWFPEEVRVMVATFLKIQEQQCPSYLVVVACRGQALNDIQMFIFANEWWWIVHVEMMHSCSG